MRMALIVQDDAAQAARAAELVRASGLRPVVARSGESALMLGRMLRPDVILLEEQLPDTDGFELCRRFRSDEKTLKTPIVLMIDLDNSTVRRRGFRVGANAHLAKPFDAPALDEALAAARAWRDELEQAQIQGEIQVELHSEAEFLADVNEFLTELCRRTPLTAEQVAHLRQSFMEMGLNAIEWGHRHRADMLVTITYRIYPDRVEVVIRDQGPGFNPRELPHAATPDDPLAHLDVREDLGLREGGFGLMIARGMLDELRHNERGNEVTLIKRFPPAAACPQARAADVGSGLAARPAAPTSRGTPAR
jgi:CheY-like chemotaxis protein